MPINNIIKRIEELRDEYKKKLNYSYRMREDANSYAAGFDTGSLQNCYEILNIISEELEQE